MLFDTEQAYIRFLKNLITGEPVYCPKCKGEVLVRLHQGAKKSNTRWKCSACGEVYRAASIQRQLQDRK